MVYNAPQYKVSFALAPIPNFDLAMPHTSTNAETDEDVEFLVERSEYVELDATRGSGAPVERTNPLGKEVDLHSAVMLNVGQILGSGIFSVPGVVLNSLGSVGLFFLAWIIAPIMAYAGLMIHTELASMFPNRSGGSVVYLEQAYPRPKFFVPLMFAITSVILSYSAINSIVFSQYALSAFEIPITPFSQTISAITVVTAASALASISTRWSLKVVNALSLFKVVSLAFVILVGVVVLLGGTQIQDPYAHFKQPFKGSLFNANAVATSLIKTNSAFAGWDNAFKLLAEVHGKDPVRTVSRASYISLTLVLVLYLATNVAYVAVIPPGEIAHSGQLVGVLFFKKVFGDSFAAKVLPIFVAGSCLGNIIATIVGSSRFLREIARQGMLPFPTLFSSTVPFGTPLFPILLKWFTSVFVISLLPAKDAFNFLMDLATYPGQFFGIAGVIGIWFLRTQRKQAGLLPTKYRAWESVIFLSIAWHCVLIFMPWVPPAKGRGDVSFWYATYCVVGLAVLAASALYYFVWIVVLPKRGGYEIVEDIHELPDGARTVQLVRRYHKTQDDVIGERSPLLNPTT